MKNLGSVPQGYAPSYSLQPSAIFDLKSQRTAQNTLKKTFHTVDLSRQNSKDQSETADYDFSAIDNLKLSQWREG